MWVSYDPFLDPNFIALFVLQATTVPFVDDIEFDPSARRSPRLAQPASPNSPSPSTISPEFEHGASLSLPPCLFI